MDANALTDFDVAQRLGCAVVKCRQQLVRPYHEIFEKVIEQLAKELGGSAECKGIAIDLGMVREIDHHCLRTLVSYGRALKANGKSFFGFNGTPEVTKYLQDQGIGDVFPLHESLEKAMAVSVIRTASGIVVDMNFVNTFIESTIKTLKVQCFMEPKAGKPFLKSQGKVEPTDIAGMIGLTSSAFTGSIALCFPGKTFLAIISKMFGEECREINDDVEDSAGELVNIIFGQTKLTLNKKGYSIEKALPSVIRGNDMKVRHLSIDPTIVLPFTVDGHPFHIEIGFGSSEDK